MTIRIIGALFALGVVGSSPASGAPVTFGVTCGANGPTCSANDYLKITAKVPSVAPAPAPTAAGASPEATSRYLSTLTAATSAAAAQAEKVWAGGGITVQIADAENPENVLPNNLTRLVETSTDGERQISLRQLLAPANRSNGVLQATLLFYAGLFLLSLNTLLALPEFSTKSLAVLGISAAGYLGIRFAAQ